MNTSLLFILILLLITAIILYILFLKYMSQQQKELSDAYSLHVKKATHDNMIRNIKKPVREVDFFKMTNDGDNLCDLCKDINYVDYINGSNIYMEIGINE